MPNPAAAQSQVPVVQTVESSLEDRIGAFQDQVREAFGDSFGTKRNLRGYDADLDILCGRLLKECDPLEAAAAADKIALVRILVSKAVVLANWQKLQGSKSNQRTAIDCYEKAIELAEGQAEFQAEIRYRCGKFCASVDEAISGGKQKAIEQFRIAAAAAASGSAARVGSEQELERLNKKRWPF